MGGVICQEKKRKYISDKTETVFEIRILYSLNKKFFCFYFKLISPIIFSMKLVFLGTGTSHGIPVIGCDCAVCKSSDPHDRRYRCSAYVTTNGGKHILIDCGPEFRLQALENNIREVDAVLLTHSHADHLHGLDDLRIFSTAFSHKVTNPKAIEQMKKPPIPIYTNENTLKDVENRFDYVFKVHKQGGGVAKIQLFAPENTFDLGDIKVTPIPMMHGTLPVTGWLLTETDDKVKKKSIAYLTDLNYISDSSIKLINENCGNLVHLVIDGLRIKEHSTHFTILEAMQCAAKIPAEHVWLTHLTHMNSHEEVIAYVKDQLPNVPGLEKCISVLPAYDRLVIET